MEQFIEFFTNIMNTYGFWGCIIVIIVSILSQLVKLPLKKIITKKYGDNKKIITCWFSFLPIILSLGITFVFYSWRDLNWQFELFNWSTYITHSVVYGGLSTALYEMIDGFVKAYITSNNTEEKKQAKIEKLQKKIMDLTNSNEK